MESASKIHRQKSPPLRIDEEGAVRVGDTRVTLDVVLGAFNDGATTEEIVERYDALKLADVYSVIAYYLSHQTEVNAYLAECERDWDEARRENDARDPQLRDLRQRLLARRRQ